MAKGLRQLKVIVSVAGAKPILSTISVGSSDDLAQLDTATASLLPGPDGSPAMLVVQLSQSAEPQESPSLSASPPSSSDDPIAPDDTMANVNITGLPVAIAADGSEWIPVQRIGQTAERLASSRLFNLPTNVQASNVVFSGPASGLDAAPTFRHLVEADMPYGTSGYALIGNGASPASATYQGFLQSGTGATTRTWNAKSADWLSVLDFSGVDPTATTDSRAGIVAAGAAAALVGKALFFPNGNYLVNGTLTPPASAHWFGESQFGVTFYMQSTSATLFAVSNDSVELDHFQCLPQTTRVNTAITFALSSNNWYAHDVSSIACGISFSLSGAPIGILDRVTTNLTVLNGIDLDVNGCFAVSLLNSFFYGNASHRAFAHIVLRSVAGQLQLLNNNMFQANLGIVAIPGNGQVVTLVKADTTYVDSNPAGSFVTAPSGTGIIQRISFVNGWLTGSTSINIDLAAGGSTTVDQIDFINNEIFGGVGATAGLRATGATRLNIENNRFGLFAGSGVYLDGVSRADVGSNTFIAPVGTGVTLINATDYVTVNRNDFTGATTPVTNTASGTHNSVTDNPGLNPMGQLSSGQIWIGQSTDATQNKTVSGDATLAPTGALALATVNGNVGSFGDSSHVGAFTVNAKGLITAASSVAITAAGLTVGTSTITGGANTRILYDNSGVLGEYTLTGSGTVVVMQNTPTLTTPVIGAATGTSAVLTNQIWSGSVSSALSSLTGAVDGFRASAANVTQLGAENTTASSATQGGFVGMYSNDGAAMASGDRLGGIRAGGSSSASALRNAALIGAFADQGWVDASAYGSRWEFQTTTNGATSATTKLILGNAGVLSFGATVANTVPALKPSSASLQVRLGDDSAFADLSSATNTVTSASASALAVGRLGATTPALQVDASTATSITGIKVKSAASGGGVAVSAIGETNVALTIDAAGSGTITFGGTSTGAITLTRATILSAALTYGGVTLSNAVTGTGSMVLNTAPVFAGLTSTGAVGVADAFSYYFGAATTRIEGTSAGGAMSYVVGGNPIFTINGLGATVVSGLALKLGNAYVATPQVTSGYVTLQDNTGTTYKVLVAA